MLLQKNINKTLLYVRRWYMLLQKNINKTLLYVRKGKLTSNILFQHPGMTNQLKGQNAEVELGYMGIQTLLSPKT